MVVTRSRRTTGTRISQVETKSTPKSKKRGRISIGACNPDAENENNAVVSNSSITKKRKRVTKEAEEEKALLRFPSGEEETGVIGREREKGQIHNFMKQCLSTRMGASLYICGSAGTGKTACVTETLDFIENGLPAGFPRTKVARVNGNTYNSPEKIYNALLQQLFDFRLEEACSADYARSLLSSKFIPNRKRKASTIYIVMVDEIDQLITMEQEVLYQLFEWPALPGSNMVLVSIANTVNLKERFLPRLQSQNIEPELLVFPAYTKDELVLVLSKCLERRKLRQYFEKSALELCSRKIASKSGDARLGINYCLQALKLAKAKKADTVIIPHMSRVMRGSDNIETIQSLPQQSKVALCAALRQLKLTKKSGNHKRSFKLTVGLMKKAYNETTNTFKLPKVASKGEYDAVLARLEQCGLITIDSSNFRVDARDRNVTINVTSSDVKYALTDAKILQKILSGKKVRVHGSNMHACS